MKDGVNGFVTPVGDFKKLAQSIVDLAQNKSMRDDFSRNAAQIFKEQFTAQKIASQTYELYKSMVIK